MVSVSRAAYENGHEASVFVLAASTQFISWVVLMRGSFCGGVGAESASACGSNFGLKP